MQRPLHLCTFFLGLAAIGWVGSGYVGANPPALAVTLLIGAFYLMGGLELRRFDQATSSLQRALASTRQAPTDLAAWLDALHPSLRQAARLRIEGERVGLPGPVMTPYLVGLLVLLGMLGTFLGMVVTLNGTGLALDSAADVQAIRASLSAPVRGLGLAFGTSIAGVAASATLGLVAALCRRDRLLAGQLLDTRIAGPLRGFSLAHRREESFKLMQQQAALMPELVDRLQQMMATLERQSDTLNQDLAAGQADFHARAEAAYGQLALSVGRTLKESLTEGGRIAGATIQPVVQATMAGIAHEAAAVHATIAQATAGRLDLLATRFEASTATVADLWTGALSEHRSTSQELATDLRAAFGQLVSTFGAQSAGLLRTVDSAHADLQTQAASADQQRLAAWSRALSRVGATLQREWQHAGAQATRQHEQICQTLAETARRMSSEAQLQAKATLAEIAGLVQIAAEAPRAAAEVIGELRRKHSETMAQDNATLAERSQILATLGGVLDTLNQASSGQRAAIDAQIAASAELLERVGDRFAGTVEAEAARLSGTAAQISGSAVEVASLGETLGFALQLFSQSNDKLGAQLQAIEAALGKSTARSDEQLAYYVAQAREVIDLSISSQRQIVDDLQQLADRRPALASETSAA